MKVAFVTSSDLKCGIGAYGRALISRLPQVEWTVVGHRTVGADLPATGTAADRRFDVVHVNYEPGLFPPPVLAHVLRFGRRSLLTLHTSRDGDNRTGITEAFDRTVVHERCLNLGMAGSRFVHVHMGLPEPVPSTARSHLPPCDVGSVGFPFPWKGFPQVAAAAYQLGLTCGLLMPESPHVDYRLAEAACRAACPTGLTTVSHWVDEPDVLASMRACRTTAFAYQGQNAGISGAVRLGLAAGQPMVLTRCRQFCDLFPYEDEIEFVPTPHPADVAAGIARVLANGKRPSRVLADLSWASAAAKYLDLYQLLAA